MHLRASSRSTRLAQTATGPPTFLACTRRKSAGRHVARICRMLLALETDGSWRTASTCRAASRSRQQKPGTFRLTLSRPEGALDALHYDQLDKCMVALACSPRPVMMLIRRCWRLSGRLRTGRIGSVGSTPEVSCRGSRLLYTHTHTHTQQDSYPSRWRTRAKWASAVVAAGAGPLPPPAV